MTSVPPPDDSSTPDADQRWQFIRDVVIVQMKLVLGNLQNLLTVPISIGAALLDLLFKRGRHGARFYKVLELSRTLDEAINVYGTIGGYRETGAAPMEPEAADQTQTSTGTKNEPGVDTVIRRVEDIIVREYQKGGTVASVKAAIDRALDQLQRGNKGS
ncbi:MAG: hypothetical protein JWR16_1378 [Nevskia sp.]|nr:hypothetical protein [Nevskia sp.]